MEETLKIGGPLESVATDKKVADAIFIKDSAMSNKTQRQINSDLSAAIEAILLLIPSAASSLNKLADKAYVDSSVATNSATFRGTFNLVNDLHLTVSATHAQIGTALANVILSEDNNDFAYVQIPTSDAEPTETAQTDRYKYNGTTWEYEYTLNNSGFTSDQWAAINSGITEALVTKLSALPTNSELTEALGVLTSSITTINQKIPSAASQANQLVDTASMESYIVQVLDVLTASFNVTSSDGHVTVSISQVDGKITSVALTTLDIASAASLSLVEGRVTTAEGNISTNSADIAILQDAYAALTQSEMVVIAPTDTWPVANPEEKTIYRVVDRTNTPPQYYSDYMWNGTAMVLMATYDNAIDDVPTAGSNNLVKSGGVFNDIMTNGSAYDLSAYNNGTTYADLNAALTALSSLSAAYKNGGMSFKFVRTSDHNYIQARCIPDEFTTDITKWQIVDSKPTPDSINLVESGGTSKAIGVNLIGSSVMTDTSLPIRVAGKRITGSGYVNVDANAVCILLPCTKGDIIYLKADASNDCKYAYLPSNSLPAYQTISFCDGTAMMVLGGEIVLNNIPSDCNYLYVLVGVGESVYLENLISNCDFVYKHEENISNLQIHAAKTDREFGFYYTGTEAASASCPYRRTSLFIPGNGVVRSDEPNATCIIIPFESGEKIIIDGKADCRYAYLTSDKLVVGQTAPFCSGYGSIISASGYNEITAVSDCKFLYVLVVAASGTNVLNYIQSGTNGAIYKLNEQIPQLYYKAFTTNANINKFFKELYFTSNADYTLVKKMRVMNCVLSDAKYAVGITFRNAQNQTIYGTNYMFDTLAEAQAYKKEIFTNILNQYVLVHHFYAVADYDAIVAEGGETGWIDVTLLNSVNNIHLNPSIEEYLHNEKISIDAYDASNGKYLRFAMFSDPHYTGNDSEEAVYRNNLLINTINKIQKEKPLQFILSGGDTGIGYINNGVLANPLPDFRETFLTKFPTQFFSALGNHDGFTVQQWKDAFYHDTQFSFETEGYYFIFLDVYMDGVYDGSERVLTHVRRCYVGTDETSAMRVLLAQYDVDVDDNGYCLLQDVLDIPELAAQFTSQVNYEYQGIDFEFFEAELEKAKSLNKKPFVVAHTIMDDVYDNKKRFAELLCKYNAIYLKGHEHYSQHLWQNPSSPTTRFYESCPGWFALDWGGYGGNQTPWAVDVIEIADDGNLRVMHYIPAQTHTRSGQTYNIPESVEEYTIEASGKSLIRATFDLKDFNNNAKAD
jgi:hypothetical protein